jgi:hypothetical protein
MHATPEAGPVGGVHPNVLLDLLNQLDVSRANVIAYV